MKNLLSLLLIICIYQIADGQTTVRVQTATGSKYPLLYTQLGVNNQIDNKIAGKLSNSFAESKKYTDTVFVALINYVDVEIKKTKLYTDTSLLGIQELVIDPAKDGCKLFKRADGTWGIAVPVIWDYVNNKAILNKNY